MAKVKTKPVCVEDDSDVIAPAFLKRPHKKGCEGALFRKEGTMHVDKSGRLGNGGWVVHRYVCNRWWTGCRAEVLVTENAVRKIAVSVEVR